MPSKKDPAHERRTDSWLFRLANKRDSYVTMVFWVAWIVITSVVLTLLAVKIFS